MLVHGWKVKMLWSLVVYHTNQRMPLPPLHQLVTNQIHRNITEVYVDDSCRNHRLPYYIILLCSYSELPVNCWCLNCLIAILVLSSHKIMRWVELAQRWKHTSGPPWMNSLNDDYWRVFLRLKNGLQQWSLVVHDGDHKEMSALQWILSTV